MRVQEQKIAKTGEPINLHLIETPDIVATLSYEKLEQGAPQWVGRVRFGDRRSSLPRDHQAAQEKLRPDRAHGPER